MHELSHPVGCATLALELLIVLALSQTISHRPDQYDRVEDHPTEDYRAHSLPGHLAPETNMVTHGQQDTDQREILRGQEAAHLCVFVWDGERCLPELDLEVVIVQCRLHYRLYHELRVGLRHER